MTVSGRPPLRTDAVFVPAAGVAWVTIGDETVLYRAADASSLVLNATAGLLWRCLDGRSRLAGILDDLAAAFAADRRQVERDCVTVLDTWLAQRLVEEVDDARPLDPPG